MTTKTEIIERLDDIILNARKLSRSCRHEADNEPLDYYSAMQDLDNALESLGNAEFWIRCRHKR